MIEYIHQYFRDAVVALAFAAVVAAWFYLKRLPASLRSIRGASWPVAEGRIEMIGVKAFQNQALAELGYSYVVEGSRYSGYYSRQFADEQHAWDYATGLQGQPLHRAIRVG